MRVTVPQLVPSRRSKPRLVGTPGTGGESSYSSLFSINACLVTKTKNKWSLTSFQCSSSGTALSILSGVSVEDCHTTSVGGETSQTSDG